jgi:hypothetical protein
MLGNLHVRFGVGAGGVTPRPTPRGQSLLPPSSIARCATRRSGAEHRARFSDFGRVGREAEDLGEWAVPER